MVAAMSADRDHADRTRLLGYIEGSKRTQRTLGLGVAAAALLLGAALLLDRTAATLGLVGVGIVAVCGFWVTAAHISDWRMQIARLDSRDRGRAVGRAVRNTPTPPR